MRCQFTSATAVTTSSQSTASSAGIRSRSDAIESVSPAGGDTIRVTGTLADGTDLDQWVRVTEITRTWGETGAGDTIQIEVEAP